MTKELNLKKENLLTEQNYLQKENNRLETIIDSQNQRDKNKERLKEIEEELLEVHMNLLKSDGSKEEIRADEKKL